jgi:hypothetical protein
LLAAISDLFLDSTKISQNISLAVNTFCTRVRSVEWAVLPLQCPGACRRGIWAIPSRGRGGAADPKAVIHNAESHLPGHLRMLESECLSREENGGCASWWRSAGVQRAEQRLEIATPAERTETSCVLWGGNQDLMFSLTLLIAVEQSRRREYPISPPTMSTTLLGSAQPGKPSYSHPRSYLRFPPRETLQPGKPSCSHVESYHTLFLGPGGGAGRVT